MNTLRQLAGDVRGATRILTGAPALSATVIVLAALVIGGNTTIYSMVHTIPRSGCNRSATHRRIRYSYRAPARTAPGWIRSSFATPETSTR